MLVCGIRFCRLSTLCVDGFAWGVFMSILCVLILLTLACVCVVA